MIRIKDMTRCCGCTACQAVCPHDAISMRQDALGFKYPEVAEDRCTDCGLCEKVCDFQKMISESEACNVPDAGIDVLAARHSDAEVLKGSQSGGVFTALSDIVLSEGGVIYGAAIDQDFKVVHCRAESSKERDAFRGSKYVQSDMGDIFRDVRNDLKEGRTVMFTGTPCQVAGLSSFIPSSLRNKLILVDFVCHGVPSPRVWSDYVSYRQKKGTVLKADFRDKDAGWKIHKESFVYEDGQKRFYETYKVLFYKNIMLRHSCGVCPYDISHRKADVTIADFWGIGEMLPEFDSAGGVSMVIPHTAEGKSLVNRCLASLDSLAVTLTKEFMSLRNPNLLRSSRIYHERMEFERLYPEKGFIYAAKRWGDLGWRYKAWQLKVFIRKIFGSK